MMKKKSRLEASNHLQVSTLETALDDLKANGYFFLRNQLPLSLCHACKNAIQLDLGAKLDAGSCHQEEPIELLSPETSVPMLQLRSLVVDNILSQLSSTAKPTVPDDWTDTLYGRIKRKHFHTRFHTDAFNTVFERQFLTKHYSEVHTFFTEKKLCANWSKIPIYTFWVPLTPTESPNASHLRLFPASHAESNICLVNDRDVLPLGFKYSSAQFLGPEFPRGFEIGDLVVFHCLTLHEANPHRLSTVHERVSIDGRFLWEI